MHTRDITHLKYLITKLDDAIVAEVENAEFNIFDGYATTEIAREAQDAIDDIKQFIHAGTDLAPSLVGRLVGGFVTFLTVKAALDLSEQGSDADVVAYQKYLLDFVGKNWTAP